MNPHPSSKDFADNVKYLVEFDHDQSEALISRLNDLTKGALTLEFAGSEYWSVPNARLAVFLK